MPIELTDAEQLRALQIQERIAGGRPLGRPAEHFGEAAIIAKTLAKPNIMAVLLSEDYDARLIAKANGLHPYSLHKLLNSMISQGKSSAAEAEAHASALHRAGRTRCGYTAEELRDGTLGRAGLP